MCTCPDFVDVNAVRSIMTEAEVDPADVGRASDMLSKFKTIANALRKQPGDELTRFDLFVVRFLMGCIVA